MSKTPLWEKPEHGEGLFRAITEQSGEGISLADTGGNFTFVNNTLCGMTGYRKTALLKMNVRDLFPPDSECPLFSEAPEKPSEPRNAALMKQDGSRIWVEVKSCPVQLAGKGFVLGIFRDATKLRRMEDALAEIEQLRKLLPVCSMCKKIRDDKGYWNRIESYIRKYSEAEFSDGLCPDCAEEHYKEYSPQSDHSGEY